MAAKLLGYTLLETYDLLNFLIDPYDMFSYQSDLHIIKIYSRNHYAEVSKI